MSQEQTAQKATPDITKTVIETPEDSSYKLVPRGEGLKHGYRPGVKQVETMQRLRREGRGIEEIVELTGWSLGTVQYWTKDVFPEKKAVGPKRTIKPVRVEAKPVNDGGPQSPSPDKIYRIEVPVELPGEAMFLLAGGAYMNGYQSLGDFLVEEGIPGLEMMQRWKRATHSETWEDFEEKLEYMMKSTATLEKMLRETGVKPVEEKKAVE